MAYSFKTISSAAEGMFKHRGSKFIAFAFPVKSEQDIEDRLESVKKTYFDARHHCYAWTLGPGRKLYRANDDGEPNHSAGDPILGQIRSKGLTDILVVVVRYFGGIKLGVGGLVTAYKKAAEDALNHAAIIECEVRELAIIQYDYTSTAEVLRLLNEFDLIIVDQGFKENCVMTLSVPARHKTGFEEKLRLLNATGSAIDLVS